MWSDVTRRGARRRHAAGADRSPQGQGFLKVEGLAKTFVPAKPVFAGVDFAIQRGEFVCIIGHSGCGKTTILNVLAGLDTASAGHVFMDGREVAGPSLERGVVFQGHALMPWLSVRRNIAFAVESRWPRLVARAGRTRRWRSFVAMVGLAPPSTRSRRSCPAA
jgi:nitrate/nitrite transport system ATP-binding protein